MIVRQLLCLFSALTLAGPAAAQPPAPSQVQPAPPQQIVIHAGRLITDPGRPAQGPSTILVSGGRIQSVTSGLQPAPPGARLVDLSNRTILPGLIDTHVHLAGDPDPAFWSEAVESDEWWTLIGVKNAAISLRAGFTTVRDLGSPPDVGFRLARATSQGVIAGPRIIASGPQSRSSAAMATRAASGARSTTCSTPATPAPARRNAPRASVSWRRPGAG
jgi:imidazolonepropionase-like amidohydrolase